jgi:hypothetical protein
MAYSAGDTILDDEYNAFVGNSSSPYGYNHFAGTGSGVYGLGQAELSTVTAGDTVTASQWNQLFTGMDNIANHTNTSITASSVSAGDTIAIRAALISDLANLAAAVAGGSTGATAFTEDDQGTSTNSSTWTSTSTIERSVTFASADAMRHFFNAGGSIQVIPGTSGTTDGAKDTAFASLCAAVGTLSINAHTTTRAGDGGDTDDSFDSSNGFHDLGTSYTSKIKIFSSDYAGYGSDYIEIFAKLDAAVGTAITMTIKQVGSDPAADPTYDDPNIDDIPPNPSLVPALSMNIKALEPNNTQGLASAITVTSNTEVSNTAS